MLITPFGAIKIIADGVMIEYGEEQHFSNVRSVLEKPIPCCYKITVPTKNYRISVVSLNGTANRLKIRVLRLCARKTVIHQKLLLYGICLTGLENNYEKNDV